IYIEMPNFRLKEEELRTRLDKWLYFIRHLEDFQTIPSIFSDEVFSEAFSKAELAKLGTAEYANYEHSLKIYRDLKSVIDTAFDEGKLEGKLEIAKSAKQMGLKIEDIIRLTGLRREDIENL
ncbi:MAG TPA: PD-(D/E)XK nuclease family transposase, partial [Candidatus Kapabacteria bacterium]|nr:PD-(D/E)XK nuclease family transposase [Candidatus Kapabacteria bacterium]